MAKNIYKVKHTVSDVVETVIWLKNFFFKNFVNTCNSTFSPISDTFPVCFGGFLTVNATVESLINYFFVIFKVSRPRLAKIGLETPSLHTVLPVVDLGLGGLRQD